MITVDSAEFTEARQWSQATDETLLRRLNYQPRAAWWSDDLDGYAEGLGRGFAAAHGWPIEADDVTQEIRLYLAEQAEQLTGQDDTLIRHAMKRAGWRYCRQTQVRNTYLTGQWTYTPDEVRRILPDFFLTRDSWEEAAPSSDDIDSRGEALIGLADLSRAWPRLSEVERRALFYRYGPATADETAEVRTSTERSQVQRAVDSLAWYMNGGT